MIVVIARSLKTKRNGTFMTKAALSVNPARRADEEIVEQKIRLGGLLGQDNNNQKTHQHTTRNPDT